MTTSRPDISPAPLMAGVTAYGPPPFKAPIDLRLDANEGAPPPADLADEIGAAGPELFYRYPDARPLEAAIAERLGIAGDRVLVTAGADDAIERAMRAVLAPGRELVVPTPTFEMIPRYASLTGCHVVELPWPTGPFPIEAALAAIGEQTAMIAVVTPNSPTGLVATAADLQRLSAAAPRALLLVDLAYTEFAGVDLTGPALELDNAVVTRTFSKAWGLAGLRVGYAAGPGQVIEWMRAAGHPYAVSGLSLKIAQARVAGGDADVRCFADRIREERVELARRLGDLDVRAEPSQANFLFAAFDDADWVRDALAGLGIAVRGFGAAKPGLAGRLRITLPGDAEKFTRLTGALETALAPQAILFDMDDTLADATRSYRGATIATAADFGVAIDFDDITAAKAAGNANNDWELTYRLVRERGAAATLEQITTRFEEHYQGVDGRPGLCALETLLIDRSLLGELARSYKLGVVTGRPRKDAKAFIEAQGLGDLFGAVVTMDDAPLKPDPAPVRLALEQLGVERAWLIGDTPDDIRASRATGVVPLGVVAPADDPATATAAMFAAGAARVFAELSEIKELLR